MADLHEWWLRAPMAAGWTRDLLPCRRSEAHGRLGRRRSVIRHSKTAFSNAGSHWCDSQPHSLRAQPRRPAVPREHGPRRADLTYYRGRQLDGDTEEVT